MNNLVRSFQYFFFFTKPSSLSTLMLLNVREQVKHLRSFDYGAMLLLQ